MQATVRLRPHQLQGGFQKGLGCLMSSFCLRECIQFAKENGSRLYVCYLDCKQAFDRVWINGLFYKLSTYGLDKKILQCLFNLFSGLYSSVRHKSIASIDTFPILQSVRQGGIISPFLYLIYIDGLIKLLESSGYGLCTAGADVSSLSVADDMILVSLSKNGLQKMMNICYEYSCKWRYLYNPSKCAVTVFNESRSVNANRSWF